jgi:hypothetical protein
MQRADRVFGGLHYLLNSAGVDVVPGQDLSNLIPGAGAVEGRQRRAGKLVISHRMTDGAYWFIALPPNRPHPWEFFPYYLLVIGLQEFSVGLRRSGWYRRSPGSSLP